MKRVFDFVLAVIMTILLSPVLIAISLLVKITSKGPVMFKQRRIGKDCEEFYIYKYRSMYSDTPKNVPTHLLENPDRFITPLGKFLRKSSLDELPQLFNILKGEMSFVGPRPALYNQYDLIELREKEGVNKVRPGITGWAQVNGRDELEIPEKVKYDKYYVNHFTILFDIIIMFKTAFNVFHGKGVVEGSKVNNANSLQKSQKISK